MTDIKKVQEILKSRREERRLSFRIIHQDIRVSVRYLEAMEKGEWGVFPADVYLMGSLRKYASYLGLNAEEVAALYNKEQDTNKLKKVEQITREVLTPERNRFRFMVRAMVFVWFGIGIGGWLFYSAYKNSHSKSNGMTESPLIEKEGVSAVPLEAKVSLLRLNLEALELVWIRVTSDKKLLYEGFLSGGSSKTWQADVEMVVRIGNVRAVKLALNGVPLDPAKGSIKAVNELVLNTQTLKELVPVKE